MAKEILTEEYQDDILAANMNGLRKYRMINNGDNTFSFVDVTDYETVGTEIGAAELKRISKNINESADKNKIIDDLEIIKNVTEEGYIAGAKAVGALNDSLEEVKTSFQDGCEQIVAALTAKGATPASNNLNDILTAINNIKTDVKHRVQLNEVSTGINWGNLGFVKYFTVSVDGTVIFTSSNYNIATSYGGGGTIMDTYI